MPDYKINLEDKFGLGATRTTTMRKPACVGPPPGNRVGG